MAWQLIGGLEHISHLEIAYHDWRPLRRQPPTTYARSDTADVPELGNNKQRERGMWSISKLERAR